MTEQPHIGKVDVYLGSTLLASGVEAEVVMRAQADYNEQTAYSGIPRVKFTLRDCVSGPASNLTKTLDELAALFRPSVDSIVRCRVRWRRVQQHGHRGAEVWEARRANAVVGLIGRDHALDTWSGSTVRSNGRPGAFHRFGWRRAEAKRGLLAALREQDRDDVFGSPGRTR